MKLDCGDECWMLSRAREDGHEARILTRDSPSCYNVSFVWGNEMGVEPVPKLKHIVSYKLLVEVEVDLDAPHAVSFNDVAGQIRHALEPDSGTFGIKRVEVEAYQGRGLTE